MNTETDERTSALRKMLVDAAASAAPGRRRPWKLVSLVAAVAIASGATGAFSAAAIASSNPYEDNVIANLAASVARPNSVPVGQPHYVASDTAVTVALGDIPDGATGLAIRTSCTTPGTIDMTLDATWIGSFGCTEESQTGGGGSVASALPTGDHLLTFTTSDGTAYEAWIVWVEEPPMPTSSRQQLAEMADGIATRDEYLAAFNRFVGCMGGAGHDVLADDADSVIINYGITSEAVDSGADELCYQTQFKDVDMAWQVQNESQ